MSNLPVGNPETFLGGESEEMDLAELHGKMYGVAVSTGNRRGRVFLCKTLLAPLDFFEMVEAVGSVYDSQQLHAKAFVLNKDPNKKAKYLDECTIDFIEARYMDIIADGLLSGALSDSKEYTCRAGFSENEEDDKISED